MKDVFYREFEERFYASRETIKELRRQYLPWIMPLRELYPEGRVLDLGCGRGEWIELMDELGFATSGVDIDEAMLQSCHERGLDAIQGDAVEHLRTLPSSSCVLITAFHFVEHIPFQDLVVVIQEAVRVLAPGGLLIMETPNPENISVATCNFYLDPTHHRPLPSSLLAFLTEHFGFHRCHVLRLQEPKRIGKANSANLSDVIFNVSPDYAVVAQASGSKDQLATSDKLFSGTCGVSLESLTERFDQGLENALSDVERRLERTETLVDTALVDRDALWQKVEELRREQEVRLDELQKVLSAVQLEKERLQAALSASSAHQDELRRQIEALETERDALRGQVQNLQEWLQAVYTSTCWRVTAPLRLVKGILDRIPRGVRRQLSRAVVAAARLGRALVVRLARSAAQDPRLRSLGKRLLADNPKLKGLTRRILEPQSSPQVAPIVPDVVPEVQHPDSLSCLPKSAQILYWNLKDEIERATSERHT